MPAVHMHAEAFAGRGDTCKLISAAAAAGASGDRVLASWFLVLMPAIDTQKAVKLRPQSDGAFWCESLLAFKRLLSLHLRCLRH